MTSDPNLVWKKFTGGLPVYLCNCGQVILRDAFRQISRHGIHTRMPGDECENSQGLAIKSRPIDDIPVTSIPKKEISRPEYEQACRDYHEARKVLRERMDKEHPDSTVFKLLYDAWAFMGHRHKQWVERTSIKD